MTARDWAASVQAPIKWAQLEVEAFAAYPDIRQQLDPSHRFGRIRGGIVQRRLMIGIPVGILLGLAWLAPITGWAILYNGRFGIAHLDPRFAVTAGGILFGVGLVGILLNGVTWPLTGFRWNFLRGIHAGTTAVVGALSVPVVYLRSSGVPNGQLWAALVVATTVVALVVSVMAVYSFRHREPEPTDPDGKTGAAVRLARIDALVDALPEIDRTAAGADVAAALAELRQRGLISTELLHRAESARLGHLAIAISTKRSVTDQSA